MFNESTAKRLGLACNVDHERQLEFVNEVWDGNDGDLSIAAHHQVVGFTSHEDATVHGIQLIGLTLEKLIETVGEPKSKGTADGVCYCDHNDGAWELTGGLWNGVVSWASLTNYTHLDQ